MRLSDVKYGQVLVRMGYADRLPFAVVVDRRVPRGLSNPHLDVAILQDADNTAHKVTEACTLRISLSEKDLAYFTPVLDAVEYFASHLVTAPVVPKNTDTELLDFLSSACQQVDITMQVPMEQDVYHVSLKPCADVAPLNIRTAIETFRDIRNRYLS